MRWSTFGHAKACSAFWTQYYRYARGDGKADLWRKRHAARYVVYLVLLPALLGHAFFGFFARWLGWLGLLVGVALYCRRPLERVVQLGQDLTPFQRIQAICAGPGDPGGGRCGQDGRLSRRSLVALPQS